MSHQKISSKLPFEISKKPSDNKKALIKTLDLGNNKRIEVKNSSTNEIAIIKDKTIEKSLSNIRISNASYSNFAIYFVVLKIYLKLLNIYYSIKSLKAPKMRILKDMQMLS